MTHPKYSGVVWHLQSCWKGETKWPPITWVCLSWPYPVRTPTPRLCRRTWAKKFLDSWSVLVRDSEYSDSCLPYRMPSSIVDMIAPVSVRMSAPIGKEWRWRWRIATQSTRSTLYEWSDWCLFCMQYLANGDFAGSLSFIDGIMEFRHRDWPKMVGIRASALQGLRK
jgi:hypothetical protein